MARVIPSLFAGALLAAMVVPLIALPLHAKEKAADGDTTARMAVITNSLRQALPESGTDVRFGDKSVRGKLGAALDVLADQSTLVSEHFAAAKPALRYEARALASDARAVASFYRRGMYGSARFTLHQLTERCVSCHARLPSGDSALAKVMVDEAALAALPAVERARVQSATRQFDDAMASFEQHFANPKLDVNAMSDAWRDYLTLAVRVKGEPARALKTVRTFNKRGSQNATTKGELAAWEPALQQLKKNKVAGLAGAKQWLARGEEVATSPDDRRGLVHWLAASGALHRFIDSKAASNAGKKSRSLAEAYLLTVKTDYRVRQAYPVALAEDYLESAIRAAPRSRTAKEAYETLEKVMKSAHQDTKGNVPSAVTSRLKELKQLAGA